MGQAGGVHWWGNIQAGQRNRGSTMGPLRRRRATVMRRPRPQAPEQSSVDEEGETFTWKRCEWRAEACGNPRVEPIRQSTSTGSECFSPAVQLKMHLFGLI
ncbi:unnamed protein product [Pleuronectes platessa]|uniref:Uncharacterized protein n=1 Tax=Pleuronectes platessa TaxID=8262 RepID=A0A9N7UY40_PLEPL|nr:unnamed protein product [Pleuronectes platessa]